MSLIYRNTKYELAGSKLFAGILPVPAECVFRSRNFHPFSGIIYGLNRGEIPANQ
jgi:hypothetical protein